MKWIDSHCHLDFEAFPNPKELMAELSRAGCQRILLPSISRAYFERVNTFQQQFTFMTDVAFGLHPYFTEEHTDSDLTILEDFLIHKPCVAVGEIGLDFALGESTWEKQIELFEEQVLLAKRYDLPIVVHCRKAHDQVASTLRRFEFIGGGFIHGFSGSFQQAKRYLDQGMVLGMGGALTHERAKAMHRLVKQLPNDGYVLETDSPDMRPSFETGPINTPLNVPKIAEYIAQLRSQSLDIIFENTNKNYYSVISNVKDHV